MKADLVCKGGGIKGIALIGAISYLETCGYKWEKIAGTSAGAIVAALLAVGYTTKEIKDMLSNIEYTRFKDKNKIGLIPFIGDFISVLTNKGIYAGDYIKDYMYEKLRAKGKTKFKDVSFKGISNLKIIASDTTKKEMIILPDDLVKYGIDPMEFEISEAVRMSVSIPVFFNPVKLEYNNKTSYIVDGGLISNFPIWIFDVDSAPQWPTFGLNLLDNKREDTLKFKGTISYMLDVIETSLYTNENVFFKEKDYVRIINIPTLDIGATEFHISQKQMNELYKLGYNSAKKFLGDWNFEEYILRYRSKK